MQCTDFYKEQIAEEKLQGQTGFFETNFELDDMTWICPDTTELVVLNDASRANIYGINLEAFVVQCETDQLNGQVVSYAD